MTIDRIDWHLEAITEEIPEDEHYERAGAHIGYFLEWAYKKGFAPCNPDTNDVDECAKLVNSQRNGIQFLIENCDTKFWNEDLNEEGQKFASYAYDTYTQNLEAILAHGPYAEKYNHQDFTNVSHYLDKVYSEYLANPPHEPAKKEKQSFLQKLKGMLLQMVT